MPIAEPRCVSVNPGSWSGRACLLFPFRLQSTYALTVFRYNTEIEGKKVAVGLHCRPLLVAKLVRRFLGHRRAGEIFQYAPFVLPSSTCLRACKSPDFSLYKQLFCDRCSTRHGRSPIKISTSGALLSPCVCDIFFRYKELQQYRKGIPTLLVCNKIDGVLLIFSFCHPTAVNYAVTKKSFAFPEKHNVCFFPVVV